MGEEPVDDGDADGARAGRESDVSETGVDAEEPAVAADGGDGATGGAGIDDRARADGAAGEAEVGVPDPAEEPGDFENDYDPTQPPDDEEMPLTEHIEEMMKRLAVVIGIAALVTIGAYPFAETVINAIWNGVLPQTDIARPHVYGPLELVLTEIKVASLAGLIIALPVFVYETYLFMRPGLYPHERRYYLAAVPTSLVFALVGVGFSYFLVLPLLFSYFMYYSNVTAAVAFGLRETFDLILMMMGLMAIVFQIPLFIMLAIMMGVTSREWLQGHRLYFWGAFLGIAFLFSPDPTGMAPLIVAVTMVSLFEGTLLLVRWTES